MTIGDPAGAWASGDSSSATGAATAGAARTNVSASALQPVQRLRHMMRSPSHNGSSASESLRVIVAGCVHAFQDFRVFKTSEVLSGLRSCDCVPHAILVLGIHSELFPDHRSRQGFDA